MGGRPRALNPLPRRGRVQSLRGSRRRCPGERRGGGQSPRLWGPTCFCGLPWSQMFLRYKTSGRGRIPRTPASHPRATRRPPDMVRPRKRVRRRTAPPPPRPARPVFARRCRTGPAPSHGLNGQIGIAAPAAVAQPQARQRHMEPEACPSQTRFCVRPPAKCHVHSWIGIGTGARGTDRLRAFVDMVNISG